VPVQGFGVHQLDRHEVRIFMAPQEMPQPARQERPLRVRAAARPP
jgi:hypothetical protein